jgi:hypothetical protein
MNKEDRSMDRQGEQEAVESYRIAGVRASVFRRGGKVAPVRYMVRFEKEQRKRDGSPGDSHSFETMELPTLCYLIQEVYHWILKRERTTTSSKEGQR